MGAVKGGKGSHVLKVRGQAKLGAGQEWAEGEVKVLRTSPTRTKGALGSQVSVRR